jgi:hypothetical protein
MHARICGALAVLDLVLRRGAPVMGRQPPAPAPNDQSLRQWLHLPRRTGKIAARHFPKETAPEAAPQVAKPASTVARYFSLGRSRWSLEGGLRLAAHERHCRSLPRSARGISKLPSGEHAETSRWVVPLRI